jgi:hypothetical protein
VPGGGVQPDTAPLVTVGIGYEIGTQIAPHGTVFTIGFVGQLMRGGSPLLTMRRRNSHSTVAHAFEARQITL